MKTKDCPGVLGRSDLFTIELSKLQVRKGWNARADFGNLDELSDSIKANGVLIPLRVKKVDTTSGPRWEIIDGERRYLAAKKAKLDSVPVLLVPPTIKDMDAMVIQLVSNDGKRFLPSEEGAAFQRLKDMGLSTAEISRRVGRSRGLVDQRIGLLKLDQETRDKVDRKELDKGKALEDGGVTKKREPKPKKDPEPYSCEVDDLEALVEFIAKPEPSRVQETLKKIDAIIKRLKEFQEELIHG